MRVPHLQHDLDGSRYADPSAMAQALADAAADAGIGLTLLPVLYERAGFASPELRPDQRRFATSVDDVLALQGAVRRPLVNAGVAVHSLRAARPESMRALAERSAGPLHIHVAEQTAEVDDCLAATGCRPIEWLARHSPLDSRWHLVHATHSVAAKIDAVAARGAGVVLCPGTEANLGDRLADLPGWLAAGVPLALGSDSQVTRAWPEELRWLDGQRLALRKRNVSAAPGVEPSTAARLFERVSAGGSAAAGFTRWSLEVGARAICSCSTWTIKRSSACGRAPAQRPRFHPRPRVPSCGSSLPPAGARSTTKASRHASRPRCGAVARRLRMTNKARTAAELMAQLSQIRSGSPSGIDGKGRWARAKGLAAK